MKSCRIATAAAAAAALALGTWACSGKEGLGPSVSLSQEEVYQLADELGTVMVNYNSVASLRAMLGALRAAGPARAIAAAVPFNGSAACVSGGTTTVSGSYDETATTLSASATFSYSGCKTAHFTTDGSFSGNANATATQTTVTAHATFGGTLHVATTDGRSGTCLIDAAVDLTETQTGAITYVISGTACGVAVSQTIKTPLYRKPGGAIAVSIVVDDAANKVYSDGQLVWRGSMSYDSIYNIIYSDPTWTGPFPKLYDDGPMSAGGHEPEGAVAGDHKFGAMVFVFPPYYDSTTFEYGMIDQTYGTPPYFGWIWSGPNGRFTVYPGATADQRVAGMTLKPFGTTDVQLVLDANNLDPSGTWDLTTVAVKGSAWAWLELPLTNDGTGRYVFTLSSFVGAGKLLTHTGLATSGDQPEFMFVLGGQNYVNAAGASSIGVSAGTKASGAGAFTPTLVLLDSTSHNTFIRVP